MSSDHSLATVQAKAVTAQPFVTALPGAGARGARSNGREVLDCGDGFSGVAAFIARYSAAKELHNANDPVGFSSHPNSSRGLSPSRFAQSFPALFHSKSN